MMRRLGLALLVLLFAIVNAGCSGLVSQANSSAPVAPSITTQPTSQSVTTGQTASFNMFATGSAPLSYQWQKNGVVIGGATASSYTTPATTSSDDGAQFAVLVSNTVGSVSSNSATLKVTRTPVAPSITTQPTSQIVIAGQTASFNVAAAGTAPLSYQWQKNNVAISGATSSTYTTPATASSDNGAQFTVLVSNTAGSLASSAATLTVNAAPVAPSITTQPATQTVTAGQTASFSVAATGTAPLSYQWRRNGVAISGATSVSYTTPATTSSDNGAQFTVLVSNTAGSVTSNPATLTVNASPVAPSITTQPASQTVTAGQTASFSVAATGTAPLSYQWRRNGVAISGATSVSYTTPATAISDSGAQFTVLVSNTAGSVTSNAATLAVNPPPVQITTGSLPGGQVQTAYSATLQATGGTAPYSWSLFSGQFPNGLTLSSSSGTISGTPTLAALFSFTIQVHDSVGASASTAFSINVAAVAHSAVLAWNPSTSVVIGYNTYRGTTSGGPYTKLNSSVVPGITYTDSTVQSGLTYFYVVTGVDSNSFESVLSNELSAAIP